MKFRTEPFRMADAMIKGDENHCKLWQEIVHALDSISDDDLMRRYISSERSGKKSLSHSVNELIRERLEYAGWKGQSRIFNSEDKEKSWTLDFVKEDIAIEVAFNHGEAISWNLVKLVLSSEVNHVKKEVQTSLGVVITVTENMKRAGNFDGAVGTFEKFQRYMEPLRHMLTVPLIIIGLDPPESFNINKETRKPEMIYKLI